MPVNLNDFIDILASICKNKNAVSTVKLSLQGAAIAGACTGLGGLLLGPVGLVAGGALGGIVAGSVSPKFSSVPQILKNMSEKQKQELCNKVVYAFRDFGASDMTAVAAMVLSMQSMRNVAIEQVTNYLLKEMHLQISN